MFYANTAIKLIFKNNLVKICMKNLIFCCSILLSVISASAQSLVKVDYSTDKDATIKQLDAVLRSPEGEPNKQGLLILHHGGGFSFNTTQQYGEYFAKQGFVVLLVTHHEAREIGFFEFSTIAVALKKYFELPRCLPTPHSSN